MVQLPDVIAVKLANASCKLTANVVPPLTDVITPSAGGLETPWLAVIYAPTHVGLVVPDPRVIVISPDN